MDPTLVEQMLNSSAEEERLQGLKALARGKASLDLRNLYRALGDDSWRVRKEATEIFLALARAGELAGEVIELLHSHDNAGLRNTAVEILISIGRPALPFLIEELGCGDQDVRKFVLDILGEIGDSCAIQAIIPLLNDPDLNVRAAAAENLGKIGSSEAVPALLEAISETDLLFRFTVLEALGQIGAEVPVDRFLVFHGEKLLRKALCDCLGKIGAEDALPFLIGALADEMRNVREAAAVALERISRQKQGTVERLLSTTAGGTVPEAIADLLESGNSSARRAAVKLLGWTADERFVSRLIDHFTDTEVRENVLSALIHLGVTAACTLTGIWSGAAAPVRACLAFVMGEANCAGGRALLLEGLQGDDPELRVASAQALGKIGGATAIAPLAALFRDSSEDVREAARQALSRLGADHPELMLSVLRPLLQEEDSLVRMSAVQVLGTQQGSEVESILNLAVKDESSLVRQAAIGAFEGRVGSRHLSILQLALTDEEGEVRLRAVELLGGTGDPEALAALGPVLQDEDIWVRTTAVRAVGRLGGESAIRMITAALDDPVGLVTIAALEVLHDICPETCLAHLVKALGHPDEEVLNTALKLLLATGQADWIPAVRERLINHPHWDVRITFARALADLAGESCRIFLEDRLLIEGEDLVRQHLQEILDSLARGRE